MNKHNTIARHVASIESVQCYREAEKKKGPRPARSYRAAKRNLAKALRASVRPKIGWPTAVQAASAATFQSLRPAPKVIVDPNPCAMCGEPAGEHHCFKCADVVTIGVDVQADAVVTATGTHVPAPPYAPEDDATVAIVTEIIDVVPADPEAAAKPKRERKPAAPKTEAAPKAPKKTAAKPSAPKAAKPAASPRKRAPAKTKAA